MLTVISYFARVSALVSNETAYMQYFEYLKQPLQEGFVKLRRYDELRGDG